MIKSNPIFKGIFMNRSLFLLGLLLLAPTLARSEVVCLDETGYQQCFDMPTEDPQTCHEQPNPIIEKAGISKEPFVCSNQQLLGSDSDDVEDAKKAYTKQCKKKAKAYKKALMKNLFNKGKVGQWVQALFKKKKFKTKVTKEGNKSPKVKAAIDPSLLEGKTEKEIEEIILAEIEKASGVSGLKEKALLAQSRPEFQKGFHEEESVPLNVMVKTDRGQSCKVEADTLPPLKDEAPKKCEFCIEKNITSSFTNDCSYMVNQKMTEADALKLVGAKKTTDYCNHNMDGIENDLSEVENVTNQICDMAKSGMKPDFKIETSRNLYKDKTVDLAKKRGEFIQKYIRQNLMDPKKCDLGGETPDWLEDEHEFNKAVHVTHPQYEGAAEGDYGPSPYASNKSEQESNIKNLELTLSKEKAELVEKQAMTIKEMKDAEDEVSKTRKEIAQLKIDYETKRMSLAKIKQLDESVLNMKDELENISYLIQDKQSKINHLLQKVSDSQTRSQGYSSRLKSVDQINAQKVTLLKDFYAEKNGEKLPARSTEEWDKLLFNDFKMVRISGKAVEDSIIPGVDPKYITPAVKIALNALVDVNNFTCVVEPISTTKVTIGGVLKFPVKVAMVLTTPVVAAAGIAGTIAVSPLTTGVSFLCEGCGEPGNIPPVLRIGNVRSLDLSKSSRREAWDATKGAFKAYTSWGGLLDVDKDKYETEWSTQEIWEAEQERLSRKKK